MHPFVARKLLAMSAVLLSLIVVASASIAIIAHASTASAANGPEEQYIVVTAPTANAVSTKSTVNTDLLRSHGHRIVADLKQAGVFVVKSSNRTDLEKLPGVTGIVKDRLFKLMVDEQGKIVKHNAIAAENAASTGSGCASTHASCPQQWDMDRIHLPKAWKTTQGSPAVKIAVLDTGVTSTHEAVGHNYNLAASKSFVQPNEYCPQDAETYRSPEDFYGHGTFTALHAAGRNGMLISGIAPKTTLINVRVVGACGYASHSWILEGMLYANQVGAQIISMSLGDVVCGLGVIPASSRCDSQEHVGDGPIIYQAYQQVVNYLRMHNSIVIAAAANSHQRINQQGMVANHGLLVSRSNPADDFYGMTLIPGGVPGVVTVAATNRVTASGTAEETRYGQFGVARTDQLAVYSGYGEAIEVSAPGGSSNYNVPPWDCISSNCSRYGPSESGQRDNPGILGAWGNDASGNPCNDCYLYASGTSIATPTVAGVVALLLATHPRLSVDELFRKLKQSVTPFQFPNATPAIETDPNSPTYLYDLDYDGPAIPNRLMGSGVIDAALAVKP